MLQKIRVNGNTHLTWKHCMLQNEWLPQEKSVNIAIIIIGQISGDEVETIGTDWRRRITGLIRRKCENG